jgi:hypothetical protein
MSAGYHNSHDKEQHKEEARYQNRLIPVAWAILVMGISLAVVILLYVWIGHIDLLTRQIHYRDSSKN